MEKEKDKKKKMTLKRPKNEIELNPNMNEFPSIYESKNKTVVASFGRMNPVTTGHEKLVERVKQIAISNRATPEIYLSHSQDKRKNPLTYEQKIQMAMRAFGSIIKKSNVKNIIQLMKSLESRYENVIFVVGSDRIHEFQRILENYNGKEFNFNSIKVLSAGERDPDSDTISGMSASKMRKAVMENDFSSFQKGLPNNLKKNAKYYFDLLKKQMKLNEQLSKAQRLKRSKTLKRYQPKIQRKRELQLKKRADRKRIRRRAQIAARDVYRQKFLRGKNWEDLNPSEKSRIEKMLKSRNKMIARLSSRMQKDVRKKETKRLREENQQVNKLKEIYNQIFLSK